MEIYKNSGMFDTLGKPFTSQELWGCLLTYLPVKSYTFIDERRQVAVDEVIQKRLKEHFVRKNQTIHAEIEAAMETGDIKLAHRLAHTLKSNAAQIHKAALEYAAEEIEVRLLNGENKVTQDLMENLQIELDVVLAELKPLAEESEKQGTVPKLVLTTDAVALFEKLEPLLKSSNTECLEFVDDLRLIPGSEQIIMYIEDFDFESAVEALEALKNV